MLVIRRAHAAHVHQARGGPARISSIALKLRRADVSNRPHSRKEVAGVQAAAAAASEEVPAQEGSGLSNSGPSLLQRDFYFINNVITADYFRGLLCNLCFFGFAVYNTIQCDGAVDRDNLDVVRVSR